LYNQTARSLNNPFVRHLVIFFSTGFYSGYCPVAPGTAGTVVAVPLYLVMSRLPAPSYGITVVAFLFMSWWFSRAAEVVILAAVATFAAHLLRLGWQSKFGVMVIVPPTPVHVFFGFVLFRFFDILKPFPIKRLERVRNGYGVMADDVMAGIYSNLILHISILLF